MKASLGARCPERLVDGLEKKPPRQGRLFQGRMLYTGEVSKQADGIGEYLEAGSTFLSWAGTASAAHIIYLQQQTECLENLPKRKIAM